ncbi:MAG: lytic transglycosylase domain-containing protein [Thermodesulfobacteriota bacterium]
MTPSIKKLYILFALPLIFLSADIAFSQKTTVNINHDLAEQLPLSSFDLYLLSTITGNESSSKAIIKNPISDKISSYKSGESIDIAENKDIRIVKVFPCLGVIEYEKRYYKIYCKERIVDNSYFKPRSLLGFQISEPGHKFYSKAYEKDFDYHIWAACNKYGVDPYLVKAVIKAESNYNPHAVSAKNAQGLMQITPPTAEDYDVGDTFDPGSNIDGGVKILKDLINKFNGNVELALAAYNAGKNAVVRHGNSIPPYPETQQYVKRVLGYYSDIKLNAVN